MKPRKTTGKKCGTLLICSLVYVLHSEHIYLLENQHIPYYIENFSLFIPIITLTNNSTRFFFKTMWIYILFYIYYTVHINDHIKILNLKGLQSNVLYM
jgi:hypothetical protein